MSDQVDQNTDEPLLEAARESVLALKRYLDRGDTGSQEELDEAARAFIRLIQTFSMG